MTPLASPDESDRRKTHCAEFVPEHALPAAAVQLREIFTSRLLNRYLDSANAHASERFILYAQTGGSPSAARRAYCSSGYASLSVMLLTAPPAGETATAGTLASR